MCFDVVFFLDGFELEFVCRCVVEVGGFFC